MSLETRIVALAQAIGADIKALLGRALPAGGSTGQVLTKTSATDYAAAWQTPSSVPVYVQEADPAPSHSYIWFRTDPTGKVIDILKG